MWTIACYTEEATEQGRDSWAAPRTKPKPERSSNQPHRMSKKVDPGVPEHFQFVRMDLKDVGQRKPASHRPCFERIAPLPYHAGEVCMPDKVGIRTLLQVVLQATAARSETTRSPADGPALWSNIATFSMRAIGRHP